MRKCRFSEVCEHETEPTDIRGAQRNPKNRGMNFIGAIRNEIEPSGTLPQRIRNRFSALESPPLCRNGFTLPTYRRNCNMHASLHMQRSDRFTQVPEVAASPCLVISRQNFLRDCRNKTKLCIESLYCRKL